MIKTGTRNDRLRVVCADNAINHDHPLNEGLVSEWLVVPGVPAAGKRLLDFRGRNHGILRNGTKWNGPTHPGGFGSLSFDGTDDYVDLGNTSSGNPLRPTGAMTISAWVNATEANGFGYGCLSTLGASGTRGYGFGPQGGTFRFGVATNSTTFTALISVTGHTATWMHYVGVYLPSTYVRLYRNGIQVGENTTSIPASQYQGNGLAVRIGTRGDGLGDITGSVNDLRFYEVALDSSKVHLLYQASCLGYPNELNWLSGRTYFLPLTGIAFDAAGNSGVQTATNTYSGSATWNGSNRMLAIDVSLLGVGTTVTSMTYGGAACTFIGSKSTVTALGSVEQWRITGADSGAPAAGSNTLVVNLSGSISFSVEWASYTNVHQTSPTEGFASAQATNGAGAADATVDVTTVADNDWVHAAVVVDDDAITASQTIRNNVSFTAVGSGANEDTGPKTPAGSQTMSFTGIAGLKTWAIAAYAIRPVGAAALVYTGTSTVSSGPSILTGSASFPFIGTSAVSVGPTTFLSTGIFTALVYTGITTVSQGATLLVGTGVFTAPIYTGTIVDTIGPATVAGVGVHTTPIYDGTGAEIVGLTTLVATGVHTTPVYDGTIAGTVGVSILAGAATHTAPVYSSTGTETVGITTFVGAASFTTDFIVVGILTASAALLSTLATFTPRPPIRRRRIVLNNTQSRLVVQR